VQQLALEKERPMKMMQLTVFAAAMTLAGIGPSAAGFDNATVLIGLQESGVNGGAITMEGTSVSGPYGSGSSSFSGTYGSFGITNADGSFYGDDFGSQISVTTDTSGTLNAWVTVTGLSSFIGLQTFDSGLTQNQLPSGWTVEERTFADSTAFGTGTLIASDTFNAPGAMIFRNLEPTAYPYYALTEEYTITAAGSGASDSTISIFAIPEPTTWALFLFGFAGVGFMLRHRRRPLSALAI
jgi:hypothetical protein